MTSPRALDMLALDIPARDVAHATLARHRRIARMSGADPRVVDSPAYRATLARCLPYDVARFITNPTNTEENR